MRNLGGAKPDGMEKSTLAWPGKISMCFAEAEARRFWISLRSDDGVGGRGARHLRDDRRRAGDRQGRARNDRRRDARDGYPDLLWPEGIDENDPGAMVPMVSAPAHFWIIVAGGDGLWDTVLSAAHPP